MDKKQMAKLRRLMERLENAVLASVESEGWGGDTDEDWWLIEIEQRKLRRAHEKARAALVAFVGSLAAVSAAR